MTKDEALRKIATVNAMDYEYQAWAREALANDTSQERVDETSKNVHKPCGLECDCTDVCKQVDYKALWQQMCERCDELDKRLSQSEQAPMHYYRADAKGNLERTDIHSAQPEQEPVAWKYDVTYNQDGTVSVALPDGDELRIVLPNKQEPYCWTWDVWVSGGKWRAEYGWKKPTEKVVNLQPLYTAPPQRKPLTDEQIRSIWNDGDCYEEIAFARAIEAAHGIKGEA